MRSMKKMGSIVGLAVAVMVLAGASTASAVSITPAGGAISASSTTEHVFSITSSIKVRCNQAKFVGTATNPASAMTDITATYGTATGVSGAWCRLYVGGTFTAATVAPTGTWTLTASTYASGISTGAVLTNNGATTVTVGSCVITVPTNTSVPITGTNDDLSGLTAGITIAANGSGLSYTSSGCGAFGVPASGTTATYTGSVYDPNVWVM
jgi:hypothetical protein